MEYMTLREGPITKETLRNLKESVIEQAITTVVEMSLFETKRNMFRNIMNSNATQYTVDIANIHIGYGGSEYPGILSEQKDVIVVLLMSKLKESFPDSVIIMDDAKTYILIDWS